jgi:hypothetical protein
MFIAGVEYGHTQAIKNEIELISVPLVLPNQQVGDEVREYAKRRYYFLARYLSDSDLQYSVRDFGAPRTDIFTMASGQGADSELDYQSYKKRLAAIDAKR